MDTAQWAQGNIGVVKPMELGSSNPKPGPMLEKKARPQKDQALNCPRCNSTNTKFCYYNNYSLSQPRYFCKTCRRYWTEGGSLRNVPVGGGSRKNKRPSSNNNNNNNSSSSSSSTSSKKLPEPSPPPHNPTTIKIHQSQDLNLAYSERGVGMLQQPSSSVLPPVEISGNNSNSRGLMNSLMPMSVSSDGGSMIYENNNPNSAPRPPHHHHHVGFPLEFKPHNHHQGLNFSFEGFENNNALIGSNSALHHHQGIQLGNSSTGGGARILFPIEDLTKQHVPSTSTSHEFDHHHTHQQNNRTTTTSTTTAATGHGDPSGFWNGMLGGGAW